MKTNNDRIRTPAYTRTAYGEGISDKEMSVGDVLRSARKALIVRQIVIFFLIIAAFASVIAIVALGLLDEAFEALTNRLLG